MSDPNFGEDGKVPKNGPGSLEKKLCRSCKHEMPVDANKCIECSSLQNWKRYLSFSTAILSLILALVSVLALAIPIWDEVLAEKVASPVTSLVDVNDTGLATFVVTNKGNAPAVLEHILVGTNEAVIRMSLDTTTKDERIIKPNDISVIKLRADLDDNVDDLWELVKLYRDSAGCQIQVGVITPDGKRESVLVDVSTAGYEEPANGSACPLKVAKLITQTLQFLSNNDDYKKSLCQVVQKHPRDPANPMLGPECTKILAEF